MERSETEEHFDADVGGTSQLLWQHLSSQLIFFVLFQFASFPHMVLSLHQKVRGWTKRRHQGSKMVLMDGWIVVTVIKHGIDLCPSEPSHAVALVYESVLLEM